MNMMESKPPAFWPDRLKASAIHLTLSLVIAVLAAALVFGVWYPYPYREISGGREMFLILVTVDVILGPLMTLAVFNRVKPWPVMRRDLIVIAVVQLFALGYGLWTVCIARPVHLVFEYNRFSVVHAVDIPPQELTKVPAGVNALPLTGPSLLSLRAFKNENEKVDFTLAAVGGVGLVARPELWQPYASALTEILKEAKPASQLKTRFANRASEIDRVVSAAGGNPQTARYLPLIGRDHYWTVFVDPVDAHIVATMPLDPF
jgi:hypothetical protein